MAKLTLSRVLERCGIWPLPTRETVLAVSAATTAFALWVVTPWAVEAYVERERARIQSAAIEAAVAEALAGYLPAIAPASSPAPRARPE